MNPARIEHYESLGWAFEHDQWQNGHNGDYEDDYLVKSPRLKEAFDIGRPFDDAQITEALLLKRELSAYIDQRLRMWHHLYKNDEPIRQALAKNPDAKTVTVTLTIP